MTIYLQFRDGDGGLHEIEVPAFYEDAAAVGVERIGARDVMTLDTSSGLTQMVLPDDWSSDWTPTGYRQG
jgi:hypothetical protein